MKKTNRLWISMVVFFGIACAVELVMDLLPLPKEEQILWSIVARAVVTVPVLWYLYKKDLCLTGERKLRIFTVLGLLGAGAGLSAAFRFLFLALGVPGYEAAAQILMPGNLSLEILTLVIAAPILEELFFRGVVYGQLRDAISVRCAMVLSASMFGLYHGNLSQGIYGFCMGVFMAWAMERWNTVAAPVLIHMAANAAAVFLELVIFL